METQGAIKRVVIVDDSAVSAASVCLLLQRQAGFAVVGQTGDGLRGLEMLLEIKPELAVVDLGLPLLDGVELIRRSRQACAGTGLLVLTAYDAEEDICAAFAAGADGYCLKESPAASLLAGARRVADGRVYIDQTVARRLLSCAGERPGRPPCGRQLHLEAFEPVVLRAIAQHGTYEQVLAQLGMEEETFEESLRGILESTAECGLCHRRSRAGGASALEK